MLDFIGNGKSSKVVCDSWLKMLPLSFLLVLPILVGDKITNMVVNLITLIKFIITALDLIFLANFSLFWFCLPILELQTGKFWRKIS